MNIDKKQWIWMCIKNSIFWLLDMNVLTLLTDYTSSGKILHPDLIKAPPLHVQFYLLLKRNLILAKRHYVRININFISILIMSIIFYFQLIYLVRIIAHFLVALTSALYYSNMGNNAARTINNFAYIFATMLLIVFTGVMSVSVTCE